MNSPASDDRSERRRPEIRHAIGDPPRRMLSNTEPAHAQLAPLACPPAVETVRRALESRATADRHPAIARAHDSSGRPRVTAVIISHNRPERLLGSLHSLIHMTSVPVAILIVDNSSTPRTRRMLATVSADHPQIDLRLSDRNLGAVGGRRLALGLVQTELVLFLDDDAELMPGALEHMVAQLDDDPAAQATSATVALPDGRISHSGGSYRQSDELAEFTLISSGIQFEECDLSPSGRCDWVPWTALLARRELFEDAPLDAGMFAYYGDNEWFMRVVRVKPDCFRRSREALVLHHSEHSLWGKRDLSGLTYMAGFVSASAYFYERHGLLLRVPGMDVFSVMPELTRTDGTLDLAGARLLMELASTHSEDWLVREWMNGGLDPVLGVERTRLGDELHDCRVAVNTLRAELAEVRTTLESAPPEIASEIT